MKVLRIRLTRKKQLTPYHRQVLRKHVMKILRKNPQQYAEKRWEMIKLLQEIIIYRIMSGEKTAGWIFFNNRENRIIELVLNKAYHTRTVVEQAMDALLRTHKLISAEVPEDDKSSYDLLETYGFRPTKKFLFHDTTILNMELSTAVYLEKIKSFQLKKKQKRQIVVIEKINPAQTSQQIRQGIENILKRLGGLRKFLKKDQTVVIKPNIVSDHGLRDGKVKGGIVTDIRVVKAMVEILLPVAGRVIIAEGSSINRSETMKMFDHYRYDKIVNLNPEKVHLVDLNSDEYEEVLIPGGRRLKTRKIPKTIQSADLVINMPVLKLHFAARASLSIKNLQGAIPPLEKYKVHFFGLWQNLINTYKVIMPGLIIMDGLFGQEGFGPVSGTPKKMDILIGGTNPVAVDRVALDIMGLKIEDSPPVLMAYHEGLGPVEEDLIEIKGTPISRVKSLFKRPEINLSSGMSFFIHNGGACPGCRGYLHFVLNKLRRPDPLYKGQLLIDRPFKKNVNVYLGPQGGNNAPQNETNIFMGICQQHHVGLKGKHLPGCPPHAEEIINAIFGLYKDIERPKYADKTEEAKLGELLKSILESK